MWSFRRKAVVTVSSIADAERELLKMNAFACMKAVNDNVLPEDRESPEEEFVTCAYCGSEKDTPLCPGCGARKSV